ncbi:MAG: alpha/beta hydrolase family protein [Solirubrobacteraceae bacterium]
MFKWAPRLGRVVASALVLAGAVAVLGDGSSPALRAALSADGRTAGLSHGARGPFAVGKILVRFIDTRRLVHFPGRRPQPRPLVTVIRYPAIGDPSRVHARARRPARSSGPFPLVVFGHGFNATPRIYARLLQAWARAGYVVAAPVFPLSNEDAPGGADEADIVNQPADMSFVITQILAAAAADHGILSGLVDWREVAVSGQSDGGATALATAYDTRYLDRRVDAAIILSGAEIMPGDYFRSRNPPLLASQGTADVVNLPRYTYDFFRAAHTPKFLLRLLGSRHLGPYTKEQPQLGVVERVTVAFLNRYLKRLPGSRSQLWLAGNTPRVATLSNGG